MPALAMPADRRLWTLLVARASLTRAAPYRLSCFRPATGHGRAGGRGGGDGVPAGSGVGTALLGRGRGHFDPQCQ